MSSINFYCIHNAYLSTCILQHLVLLNRSCLTAWLIATVGAYKSGCIGGYCFVISDIQKNNERLDQPTAQQRCQSNGTQLVEIRNQDIQISLANFISSQGLNGWNVLTNGKRTIYSSWHRLSGFGAGKCLFNFEKSACSNVLLMYR